MEVLELMTVGDESYPQVNPRHPRNRGVDWVHLGEYLRGEAPDASPAPQIFVKANESFDALHIALAGWIISRRARAVLEPLITNDVVFASILVNDEEYWGMRVIRLIPDALDMDLSKIAHHPTGRIKRIVEPVWRASSISDPVMFGLPQKPYTVWTTRSVAAAYQAAGCTGITFWPSGRVLES